MTAKALIDIEGFEYDWLGTDDSGYGGPYDLVAAPAVPVRVDALPPEVASIATAVSCSFRFESTRIVTHKELPE